MQSAGTFITFIGIVNMARHLLIVFTYDLAWVLLSLIGDIAYIYVGYHGFKAGKDGDEYQIAKYYKRNHRGRIIIGKNIR